MALGIDMNVERSLQQRAEGSAEQERQRQAEQERHAHAIDQHDSDIAAGHRERAVRQIDEIHQPERDGKPAGQHEQQHAIGDAVEQDSQHAVASMRAPTRTLPDLSSGHNWARALWRAAAKARSAGFRYFLAAFTGSFTASKVANSTFCSSLPTFSTLRM